MNTESYYKKLKSLDIIEKKFPEHSAAIKKQYLHSPVFREICLDYLEIFDWIKQNNGEEENPAVAFDHANELLKELGEEIMLYLEGYSIRNKA